MQRVDQRTRMDRHRDAVRRPCPSQLVDRTPRQDERGFRTCTRKIRTSPVFWNGIAAINRIGSSVAAPDQCIARQGASTGGSLMAPKTRWKDLSNSTHPLRWLAYFVALYVALMIVVLSRSGRPAASSGPDSARTVGLRCPSASFSARRSASSLMGLVFYSNREDVRPNVAKPTIWPGHELIRLGTLHLSCK
jgi:hypothetical protein